MSAARKRKLDLLDAALALVERDGWHRYGALALARETGAGLAEICAELGDRAAVVAAVGRRADISMVDLAATDLLELTPRERVFELMMRRFDALRGARKALAALRNERALDAAFQGLGNLRQAMRLITEAAGLDSSGPRRAVLLAALATAYVRTGNVWLGDDSEDQATTLAELDKQLDKIASLLPAAESTPKAG